MPCQGRSKELCNAEGVHGCMWGGSSCRPYLEISIGATGHFNHGNTRTRPESVHTEICAPNCGPCDDRDICWHGTGGMFIPTPDLKISVPANSPKGVRTVSFWSRCEQSEGADWVVKVDGVTNGAVNITIDGVSILKKDEPSTKMTVPMKKGDHQIKASFYTKELALISSAQILIKAIGLMPWVETCMDSHLCLKKLGDASKASFGLRNNNRRQRDCLVGKAWPQDADKCQEWDNCLQETPKSTAHTKFKATLEDILNAVLPSNRTTPESLAESPADAPGCIDPEISDPEAFECECLEKLQETCEGEPDQMQCFRNLMCEDPRVCCSWKQAACSPSAAAGCSDSSSSMTQRANVERLQTSTDLDTSVAGKCSSETQ